MKFKTAYDRSTLRPCGSGSRFSKTFVRSSVDGDLVESGSEDIYDSIQKAAQGIRLEDLIRRARNGDPDAIPLPLDSYGDISHMPKDLLEAHGMLIDYRAKFNSLPVNLKNKYGNDFKKFLEAVGDGSIKDAFKVNAKSIDSKVTPLSSDELSKIRSMIGGTQNNA